MILAVKIKAERVLVGERFSVSFQRTQKVAPGLHAAQRPPSWGALPVHAVSDYPQHISIPDVKSAFLIPVGREEAVWLGFGGAAWKPNALKVGVGGHNAVTGEKWDEELRARPQDYLVCPPQLSLEVIRTKEGSVSQIVAGSELSDAGDWEANRIGLIVYEPKRGIFAEQPPGRAAGEINVLHSGPEPDLNDADDDDLKRRIEGEVHRDPYEMGTWDTETIGAISVYMVGHQQYKKITGCEPPPRPADRDIYQGNYLP
jgi:hypothetical protein